MSRRRHDNGRLVEEWDVDAGTYRRWSTAGVLLEQRAITAAEIANTDGSGGVKFEGTNLTASGVGLFVAKHADGSEAVWLGTQTYAGPVVITGITLNDPSGALIFMAAKDSFFGARFRAVASNATLEHPTSGALVGHTSSYFGAATVVDGKTGAVLVRSDGGVTVKSNVRLELDGGPTNPVRLLTTGTTGASANVYQAIGGDLVIVVSSRRYKQDIADHDIDPLAVLKMRVRTWRDRSEVKKDPATSRRYIGFIAEEVHDLGLTEFVEYDEQGRPNAISYDRIPVALLIALRFVAKQVKTRTDALEATVAAQQTQIDALAARLTASPTT